MYQIVNKFDMIQAWPAIHNGEVIIRNKTDNYSEARDMRLRLEQVCHEEFYIVVVE